MERPPSRPEPTRSENRLRLSLFDLVFAIWAVILPLGMFHRLISGDGDLFRHIRVGEHILHHGFIGGDPFSHTRAGEPFLEYEWLSQVLFAVWHAWGGLPAVAIFAGMLIALVYASMVLLLRRAGVDPFLAYLVSMVAAVLGGSHWIARPHLFSLLFTLLVVWWAEHPSLRRLWILAPLFCLWANLHPGFVLGLGVLGLYAVGDFLTSRGGRNAVASPGRAARARLNAAAFAIGLLASLLNPNGVQLLAHIFAHLTNSYLMSVTHEFMSPNFHTLGGRIFLSVLLGLVFILSIRGRRTQPVRLLLLLAFLAFALRSQRNIPLFGVAVLPVFALELDQDWRALRGRFLEHVRGVFSRGEAVAVAGPGAGVLAAAMLLLAFSGGRLGGVPLMPARPSAAEFPIEAVERARAAGLSGPLFNEFLWGGYLVYAWPEQKVFIDGMTDFYGEDLTRTYVRVAGLQPGWREELQKWAIGLVVVPSSSRLAHALAQEPGWEVWHRDPTATVLRRSG